LPDKTRLFECALSAYMESGSFADSGWKVEHLLASFDDLTASQVDRVLAAYRANGQNKQSFKGMNHLLPLLKRWTQKDWTVENNELTLMQPAETEIPF